MIFIETHITESTLEFFEENLKKLLKFSEINSVIERISGIKTFFVCQNQADELLEIIKQEKSVVSISDRREYGDFQTNENLAFQVTEYAYLENNDFEFILEPTCGKGNFILASIKQSGTIKKIVGVEIYQPYVWETKFKILDYFLLNKVICKPEINIIHGNVFDYDYEKLAASTSHLKTLIIGNPPWVTNSELGSINSKNLPQKSNFKNHSGFEAITGKGNFDIGEYISLIMLKCFEKHNGNFAFLLKNSVVKNLIQDQKRNNFKISKSEKLNIDSKKEFNVSVNSCLFITQLNTEPDFICKEINFYNRNHLTTFGWYKDKFVYSLKDYDKSSIIDGKSILTWRSGVKHDCSKVMEFERLNGHYINGLGEEFNIENKLVFGLLKSSDLKVRETNTYRKLTIITQRKIGQNTEYIEDSLPLTYKYLDSKRLFFDKRKSSIYNNKPNFSIFGIGDYSFAKYKIAISGLYKSTHFTLVKPENSKTIMVDDTCYFIGFENLNMAKIAHFLVNSKLVQQFLKSIIFSDSKRSINKDTLMRIDLGNAFKQHSFHDAKKSITGLKIEHWKNFEKIVTIAKNEQITIFNN